LKKLWLLLLLLSRQLLRKLLLSKLLLNKLLLNKLQQLLLLLLLQRLKGSRPRGVLLLLLLLLRLKRQGSNKLLLLMLQPLQLLPKKNSFDSQVSTDLGPFVDPVYNFEYKVADDQEKTYISRNEERDGNELSGSYSFIDATGALVTVDYTAGVNGYAETRSKEAGKVTMKAVPAWDGPLAGLEEPSGAISVAKGATSSSSRFGSSSGSRSSSAIRSSSSQSDLIAQILAALTPQINSAVAAALA